MPKDSLSTQDITPVPPPGYSLVTSNTPAAPRKLADLMREANQRTPATPPKGYIVMDPDALKTLQSVRKKNQKAQDAGPSIKPYAPSTLEQLRDTVANTAIGYSLEQSMPKLADALNLHPSETVNSPTYQQHKEQLLAPEYATQAITENSPVPLTQAGSERLEGALKGVGGLTSASNMATMAGTAVAAGLTAGVINPAWAQLLSRAVSGGFTLDMLYGLYQQNKEYKKAIDSGNLTEAHKIQGEMGVNGIMAALTAHHALTSHPFTPVEETPTRERTNVLHRNEAGEVRQANGQAPTVWLSPTAWGHFMGALYPGEDAAATHGINLPANEHLHAFANDQQLGTANPQFGQVQELLAKAHEGAGQGSVAIGKNRPSIQANVNVMREELNHTWQRGLTGKITDHLPTEAFSRMYQAIPSGMYDHLMEHGYDGYNSPEMVTETAAKLMDGRPERFGVDKDDAVDFLDKYFSEVSKQHGAKALESLQHVRGIAKEARDAAIAEHSGGPGGGQDNGTVSGVGNGRQGGSGQGVPAEGEVAPYEYKPISTDTPVSGKFYHGTKAPISSVSELDPGSHGNEQALYGIGTYLTDSPDVAKGYAKTKGKGAQGKVLTAHVDNAKLLDLEQPVPPAAHTVFENMIQGVSGDDTPVPTTLTGKELFKRLQNEMEDTGYYRSDAQETLGNLTSELRQNGYEGLRHEGGKGDKPKHNVAIIFPDYGVGRPTTDIVRDSAPQTGQDAAFNREKEKPVWYLKSERLIADKMKGPMPAEDTHKMLLAGGVKPEEMHWTGLDDFLKSKGKEKVTPEEIREHLANNNIKIKEVTKGSVNIPKGQYLVFDADDKIVGAEDTPEAAKRAAKALGEGASWTDRDDTAGRHALATGGGGATKYGSYVLPGGESYREMLLTMPPKPFDPVLDKEFADISKEHNDITNSLRSGSFTPEQQKRLAEINQRQDEILKLQDKHENSGFKSNHWEEPNILAHIRFNDRTGPSGEKLLHVEELQSDSHQAARKKGYQDPAKQDELLAKSKAAKDEWQAADKEVEDLRNDLLYDELQSGPDAIEEAKSKVRKAMGKRSVANDKLREAQEELRQSFKGVPDLPWKKNWHEQALRRMLKHAAENNYEGLSWTPGDAQAERYDLSKQVGRITYAPVDGTLRAYDLSGNKIITENATPEELPNYIGKEAANKLLQTPRVDTENIKKGDKATVERFGKDEEVTLDPDRRLNEGKPSESIMATTTDGRENRFYVELRDLEAHKLSGVDLKVGGEGMHGFYDKIVPDYLNKFGKKYGAKVGTTEIPTGEEGTHLRVLRGSGSGRFFIEDRGQMVGGEDYGTKEEANKAMEAMKKENKKTVPYLPITPEMRKSVSEEGVPLFNREVVKNWFGSVPSGETAITEGGADSRPTDSEPVANLLVSRAFRLHGLSGLDVPSQRPVLDAVLALGQDPKILRTVIKFIPVDVMNILKRENLAPDSLFRDEAVLRKFLSVDHNGSVATAIDVANALVSAVASVGTEIPNIGSMLDVLGGSKKLESTLGTSEQDHPEILHNNDYIKGTGNPGGSFDPNDPNILRNREKPKDSPAAPQVKISGDTPKDVLESIRPMFATSAEKDMFDWAYEPAIDMAESQDAKDEREESGQSLAESILDDLIYRLGDQIQDMAEDQVGTDTYKKDKARARIAAKMAERLEAIKGTLGRKNDDTAFNREKPSAAGQTATLEPTTEPEGGRGQSPEPVKEGDKLSLPSASNPKTVKMLTSGKAGGYRLDYWLKNQPGVTITSVGKENINPSALHRIQDWTREGKLADWKKENVDVSKLPPVEVVRTASGDYLYDGTHRTEYATRQGEKIPATVYTIKTRDDSPAADRNYQLSIQGGTTLASAPQQQPVVPLLKMNVMSLAQIKEKAAELNPQPQREIRSVRELMAMAKTRMIP